MILRKTLNKSRSALMFPRSFPRSLARSLFSFACRWADRAAIDLSSSLLYYNSLFGAVAMSLAVLIIPGESERIVEFRGWEDPTFIGLYMGTSFMGTCARKERKSGRGRGAIYDGSVPPTRNQPLCTSGLGRTIPSELYITLTLIKTFLKTTLLLFFC